MTTTFNEALERGVVERIMFFVEGKRSGSVTIHFRAGEIAEVDTSEKVKTGRKHLQSVGGSE